MAIIEREIFKRYTPDFEKLKKYGFEKTKACLTFEKFFKNGEFKAHIKISKSGVLTGKVFDVENEDEFLPLRIDLNEGSFVADVRKEYSDILVDIRDKCFIGNSFVSPQANRIASLIYEKYGDKPLFMWEKSPDCGVFKNPKTDKWYGIIMYIERSKLGQKTEGFVEVMNIKLDKDEIVDLLNEKGFYPAYHMNKKYWISIVLDETLSDSVIMSLIEESYGYSVSRKKS